MDRIHTRSDGATRPHERPQRKPERTRRSAVPLDWKGIGSIALLDAGVRRCDRRGRVASAGRYVRIPARFPDGTEHRAQLYGPDGRPCGWTPGESLIPFGLDTIARDFAAMTSAVFILEGASDWIAFRAWCCEWDGLRADAIALPGASTWRSDWTPIVAQFSRVYVVGDGNAAGQKMNAAVARDVRRARVVRLCPDQDDVRNLIQGGRGDELAAAISRADMDALLFDAFHQPNVTLAGAQLRQALRRGYRPADLRYAA